MSAITRALGVLRREGPAGIIGRLRNPQAAPPPPPPSLADGAHVLGDHPMAGLLRALSAGNDTGPRVVIGGATTPAPSPGDIVVATREAPDDWLRGCWDRAALVVEFDADRIRDLAARPRGRPHVMVIPPPPVADAGAAAWVAYQGQAKLHLQRLLVFCEALSADQIDLGPLLAAAADGAAARAILPGPALRVGLSLPETPARRAAFLAEDWHDLRPIDGLRQAPGWRGAASTYRQLARAALAQGGDSLLVCQDDALAGPDFARRYGTALRYWKDSGAAMFAGLVTDVDDSIEVRRVERVDGVTFLHLNRSVGLVFNIFARPMLQHIAAWDEADRDRRNTVDRYISRFEGGDVVTCLPYLVHHRNDQASSVWEFDNARYDSIIRASERRLARKAGIALGQGGD